MRTFHLCSGHIISTTIKLQACFLVALGCGPLRAQYVPVYQSGSPNSINKNDAAARSLAALDLAILAAESGIPDVSFEAVRRAVGSGPPVSTVDLGGLLRPGPATSRISYGGGGYGSEPTQGQADVAGRLVKIQRAWEEQKFDPRSCYQVLKELVFPSARPSDAFPYASTVNSNNYSYSLSLAEAEPADVSSGASLLAQWAKDADMLADLRATMEQREKFPGARATVQLLTIILAKDDPSLDTEALCQELSKQPNLLISGRDAELLMSATYQMLQSMPSSSQAKDTLWSSILNGCRTTQQWASNRWLRYAIVNATREALELGNREQFLDYAEVLLTILAPFGPGNAEYLASSTSRFYGEASAKAFEAGKMELGIECLKQQFNVGSNSVNPSVSKLVNVNSAITRNLMKMTPQARHAALFELVWNMPLLGLADAAQVAPQDKLPEPFVRGYKNYRKTDKLPLEQVTDRQSRSISLLEWVIRDAIELGKLDLVNERVAALEASGSDDAPLAKLVLAKALGQPLDLSLVSTQNADGKPVLRSEVTGRGPLLPLDLEIASVAIAHDETRQLGIDLAERLADRGFQNRSNDVLQGRMLAGLARLQSDTPPASSSELVHFVKGDDFSGVDLQAGKPDRSLWLETAPGSWEHQACTSRSSLLLKYPLLGQFEISFRCTDETYGESATTFGGLYIDFRGYLNDVALATVGGRSAKTVPNQHVKRGGWTAYTLKRDSEAGSLTLMCEGSEVAVMQIAAQEFPFYGLQSMMHRKMTTEGIEITGNVTIPDSLQLVTQSLLGWSAHFKSRRLPPINYLPSTETDQTARSREERADLPYDWHYVDGVIESVNHEQLLATDKANGREVNEPTYRRREEWLYYLRPLCDGEQVDFEFYHEAGKFSVHPTIDRVAVWFDEPQLRRHWITSDSGHWFGVSNTNRLPIPQDSVLGQAALQEAAWNIGGFRRAGDKIILSINGQDLYRQKVDETLGGRFGFFHDPTLFHVRLRNIRLSGDWPSQLPEVLFEKRGSDSD